MKGYFDLMVGGKQEKEAYTKMTEEMDLKPEEVIFFTGVTAGREHMCSFSSPSPSAYTWCCVLQLIA